jgi:hypothetical protein
LEYDIGSQELSNSTTTKRHRANTRAKGKQASAITEKRQAFEFEGDIKLDQVIVQEDGKKKRIYDHGVRQTFAGSDSEFDSNVGCGAQERRSGKMQSDEVGKKSRGILSSSGTS